eukprot:TRINITY_DN15730_c0_g1_i1.p1 TRINITY_DN15730_c0_g1~~TRINITY_DN15730_c0_g1_i1.p1  ORF type:complete len:264 (-),score=23.25 TRINITY_DN15730_c0_g1_i1:121-912(-)
MEIVFSDIFNLWLNTFITMLCLYFGYCFILDTLIIPLIKIQKRKKRKISILVQECYWSIICIFFGSLIIGFCRFAYIHNLTYLYWNINDYGYVYFFLQFIFTWIGNDAWQYWTHRALHNKKIYYHIHKIHHKFYSPTVYATMSFHPVEACIQFIPSVAILFTPVHAYSLFFNAFCFFTISILEHCGKTVEKLEEYMGHTLYLSTPLHHDIHHSVVRCNFAVYFIYWDIICNTRQDEEKNKIKLKELSEPLETKSESVSEIKKE